MVSSPGLPSPDARRSPTVPSRLSAASSRKLRRGWGARTRACGYRSSYGPDRMSRSLSYRIPGHRAFLVRASTPPRRRTVLRWVLAAADYAAATAGAVAAERRRRRNSCTMACSRSTRASRSSLILNRVRPASSTQRVKVLLRAMDSSTRSSSSNRNCSVNLVMASYTPSYGVVHREAPSVVEIIRSPTA